jgi:hypothetical protein
MNIHQAIRNTHSTVVTINGDDEAYDAQGNRVALNTSAIATELARMKADYESKQYQRDRVYPTIGEQLDMLWHAIDTNSLNKTSDFYTTLKAVKDAHPKSGE